MTVPKRKRASRGYVNFAPVPNTQPDAETRTIKLQIDCNEGKHFHFGQLAVVGRELHLGDNEMMVAAWGPYEGRIYDQTEVEAFWDEMTPLLPPGWQLEQHLAMYQNPKTSTADLGVLLPGADR